MNAQPELRSVVLPDGRSLSFREFGDPLGTPVVSSHGGLVCGLDIGPADGEAKNLGIRIIAPDRPGVGYSTNLTGRTTDDWAHDIWQLAGHLNLARFAVFGWSLGGQYALALAAKLPERVTRAAVVAGSLPLQPASRIAELSGTDRRLLDLSQRRPRVARVVFRAMGSSARRIPTLVNRATSRELCESDRAVLNRLPTRAFGEWIAHAMTQPDGMVGEYLAWRRPWGFGLDDVGCPTTVWQGGADALVPSAWATAMADAISAATLRMIPDEGHFLAYPRWSEVLSDLTGLTPGR